MLAARADGPSLHVKVEVRDGNVPVPSHTGGGGGGGGGGGRHDHLCAIFADSAPSNVCEFPIIGDRGISADIC